MTQTTDNLMRAKKYRNIFYTLFFQEFKRFIQDGATFKNTIITQQNNEIIDNNKGGYYEFLQDFIPEKDKKKYVYRFRPNAKFEEKEIAEAIDRFFFLFSTDEEGLNHIQELVSFCIPTLSAENDNDTFCKLLKYGDTICDRIANYFGVTIHDNNEDPTWDKLINHIAQTYWGTNSKHSNYYYYKNALHIARIIRNSEAHVLNSKLISVNNWIPTVRFLLFTYIGLCLLLRKSIEKGPIDSTGFEVFRKECITFSSSVDGNWSLKEIKQGNVIPVKNSEGNYWTADVIKGMEFTVIVEDNTNNQQSQVITIPVTFVDVNITIDNNGNLSITNLSKVAELIIDKVNEKVNEKDNNHVNTLTGKVGEILDKLNQITSVEQPSTEYSTAIEDLFTAILTSIELIGNNDLSEITNKLEELSNKIDENCNEITQIINECSVKLLTEIYKKINELNQNIESVKEKVDGVTRNVKSVEKNVVEISTGVGEINSTTKNTNNIVLRMWDSIVRLGKITKVILCVIAVITVLLGTILCIPLEKYYEWTSSEVIAQRMHDKGDATIAHRHAELMEKQEKYVAATEWYQRARSRYATIVDSDTTQTEYAYQLALLYSRLKGGIDGNIDYTMNQACKYARIAGYGKHGRGLEIYLNIQYPQNDVDTRTILNQLEEYDKSDYVLLSKAIMQINSTELRKNDAKNRDLYIEAFNTVDSLRKHSQDIKYEAESFYCECALNGILMGDEIIIAPDLYAAHMCMYESGIKHNNNIVLCIYIQELIYIRDFEQLTTALDRAWKNGLKDIAALYYIQLIDADIIDAPDYEVEMRKFLSNTPISPISLVYSIENNRNKGYTESKYIWDQYIKLTDRIENSKYYTTNMFYREIIKSELTNNIHSIEDAYNLINSVDTDQQTRKAFAEYLIGVKYGEGYGVDKNIHLSDSLIRNAAFNDCVRAQYAYGRRLINEGYIAEGIAYLEEIAPTIDDAALYLAVWYRSNGYSDQLVSKYIDLLKNNGHSIAFALEYFVNEEDETINLIPGIDEVIKNINNLEYAISYFKEDLYTYPLLSANLFDDLIRQSSMVDLYNNYIDSSRLIFYANIISRLDEYIYCTTAFYLSGVFVNIDPILSETYINMFCEKYFGEDYAKKINYNKEDLLDLLSFVYPDVISQYITQQEVYQRYEKVLKNINEGKPMPNPKLNTRLEFDLPIYIL